MVLRIEAQIKTYDFFKFMPKQNKKTTCLYFRKVRLDEVLEEIEKYCDSDETSDENEEQMNVIVSTKQIAVYISPPDNGGITDEDSGGEDTVTLANLPGNQITAAALRLLRKLHTIGAFKVKQQKAAKHVTGKRKTYQRLVFLLSTLLTNQLQQTFLDRQLKHLSCL